MAKKKKKMTCKKINKHIDHIPKCSQQHRSPGGSKRRTDFSLFFCSSNANLLRNLLPESPSSKEVLSSITVASPDEAKNAGMDVLDIPLAVKRSESQMKTKGILSNPVEVPIAEVSSVAQNEPSHPLNNRNVDEQGNVTVRTPEFTPDISHITESSDARITPGTLVWAKTSNQLWWPAEIMRDDSGLQRTDGLVLVQYYRNQESAWVDPAKDLSPFEDCFEERSCNPMEEFQDALKLALLQKEQQTSSEQCFASPDGPDSLNVQYHSPDTRNSSNSSRTGSVCLGTGRSRRNRKPKVPFDEVTVPSNSTKKVRRLRIMRYLGLAAPAGSPFLLTPNVRTGSD